MQILCVQPEQFNKKMKKEKGTCFYKSQCDIGKGIYKEKSKKLWESKNWIIVVTLQKNLYYRQVWWKNRSFFQKKC